MKKGFFLVFEGIDKCGKSTQAALLGRYLEENGIAVTLTREPGGTSLGEEIRSLLLHTKGFVEDRAELLLYEASRAQHMAEKVLPALNKGNLVLSDRFYLATSAYQGVGRGLPLSEIDRLNRFASFSRAPDLTFVVDIAVEESMRRIGDRPDRMEKEELLRKVRAAYRRFAKEDKDIVLIDGKGAPDLVHQRIMKALGRHAGFKRFMKEMST